jgi:hypothetical protein
MSFMATIKTEIKDLDVFKQVCANNNVVYESATDNGTMRGNPVEGYLKSTSGKQFGYLLKQEGGYRVMLDRDGNYCPESKRLGGNGSLLTRDYSTAKITKEVGRMGGVIMGRNELPNGSILLRVAVG